MTQRHLNPLAKKLLALAAIALLGSPALAVDAGQSAPAFELPGRNGTLSLDKFKGKTVYLDFWASWCGPCKQSFPWMNEMQSRYGAQGLQVLAINLDQKAEDAQSFLKANPANFEVAFDPAGKVPHTYAIKGMPTSMLIAPNGQVLMVHSGFKEEQARELEQLIQQALTGKGRP
jgi:thiol-disulfide isomerase/thioredoxin